MMYKLTVYQHRGGELFPLHVYLWESRDYLERMSDYHKAQNENVVSILISYERKSAEVLA